MQSISDQIEEDKKLAASLEGTYLFDGARARKNYPLKIGDEGWGPRYRVSASLTAAGLACYVNA